jgi:hypothetical protein
MTAKQSTSRLILYSAIAFLTPIGSNWEAMANATVHQWIGMFIQATITALIAGRAYIDTSPSKVDNP